MGELGGFLRVDRHGVVNRDPRERADDYEEFVERRPEDELRDQGGRCMDCGIPFCHNGCPLGNLIPDWNDLVSKGRWDEAIRQLHATNNFPDWTGRICPAPCEAACVLEINEGDAVTIKQIEHAIVDRAFDEGWIVAEPPRHETGHRVVVVGSGPAGMACAQQLRRAGHGVVLLEKDEAAGGLCRFGVPDFKLSKHVVQRRVQQLVDEGVEVRCGVEVGVDVAVEDLRAEFDAVVLAIGSRVPRDLPIPGRELDGIHFAMDFLYDRTRETQEDQGVEMNAPAPDRLGLTAEGKDVVVIGGGDTGADCVAQSIRQGARSVTQLELLPEPPAGRPDDKTPWPLWPAKFRLSYAMEEARALGRGVQTFSIASKAFAGEDGAVTALRYAQAGPEPPFAPVEGGEKDMPAQLVLLAMGFLHPEHDVIDRLGLVKDQRGNVKAGTYATSEEGVFAAGDCRRGQSLIVWAINEGRQCARMVERYLGEKHGEPVPPAALAGRV